LEASPCRVPSARLGDAPGSVRRRPDHPPRASRGRLAKPVIDIAADPYTNACFFVSPYKRRIYRCSSSASGSGCVAGHRAVARKTGRNSPIADNRRSSAKRRDRSRFLGGDRQTDTHGVGLYDSTKNRSHFRAARQPISPIEGGSHSTAGSRIWANLTRGRRV
jgi:hypothetical protein